MFREMRRNWQRRANKRKMRKNLQLTCSVLSVVSTIIGVANELRKLSEATNVSTKLEEDGRNAEMKAAFESIERMAQRSTDKVAEVSACAVQNMRGATRICLEQIAAMNAKAASERSSEGAQAASSGAHGSEEPQTADEDRGNIYNEAGRLGSASE